MPPARKYYRVNRDLIYTATIKYGIHFEVYFYSGGLVVGGGGNFRHFVCPVKNNPKFRFKRVKKKIFLPVLVQVCYSLLALVQKLEIIVLSVTH